MHRRQSNNDYSYMDDADDNSNRGNLFGREARVMKVAMYCLLFSIIAGIIALAMDELL